MRVGFLAAGWPPSVDLSDGPRHTVRTSARPKCLEEKVIYVLGWSRQRESADTTYQRSSTIHQLKAISSDGSIISSCWRSDPKVENWMGQALFSRDEWRPGFVSFPLKREELCACCLLLLTGPFTMYSCMKLRYFRKVQWSKSLNWDKWLKTNVPIFQSWWMAVLVRDWNVWATCNGL